MKTLNIYVTRSFVVTFLMATGLLTFGLLGAHLVKIFEYLSKGIPISVAGMFMLYVLPVIMTMTIPWAILVSIMLVFGRLSADSEITAMRACGVSILQIISPILVLTIMLSSVCLFLQMDAGPRLLGEARSLVKEIGLNQPLALLDPGRPIEFEGNYIYIDDRVGENEIRDIQIYRMDKERKKVLQDITASKGKVLVDKEKQILTIELYNCTIIASVDNEPGQQTRTFSKQFIFSINYGKELNSAQIGPKIKYMNFKELFAHIRLYSKRHMDTTPLEVELNQRIALALSPIAFVLLGLPMAIRTSRRETSIGLFLSVILMGLYFLSIIINDSLTNYPKLFPQYLLWIPVVGYHIAGIIMIRRIVKH